MSLIERPPVGYLTGAWATYVLDDAMFDDCISYEKVTKATAHHVLVGDLLLPNSKAYAKVGLPRLPVILVDKAPVLVNNVSTYYFTVAEGDPAIKRPQHYTLTADHFYRIKMSRKTRLLESIRNKLHTFLDLVADCVNKK